MIRFFTLFLLPLSLYAAKILSYNIYDRTDRVDVMLTFDTPYEGTIKQSIHNSTILIKLEDATIESSKVKKITSKYMRSISITPMQGHTQIAALVPPSIVFQASKTSDAYGLRLRFTPSAKKESDSQDAQKSKNPLLDALPTKKSNDLTQSYAIVIAILVLGIIALFVIKKRFAPTRDKTKQSSWLFQDTNNSAQKREQQGSNNVTIRFQKSLDAQNSVVMLDFQEQSYLVMMGKSNILLDKFNENKPVTQEDFNSILQSRHEELENFLNTPEESQEPLESYKKKAASIRYEV